MTTSAHSTELMLIFRPINESIERLVLEDRLDFERCQSNDPSFAQYYEQSRGMKDEGLFHTLVILFLDQGLISINLLFYM